MKENVSGCFFSEHSVVPSGLPFTLYTFLSWSYAAKFTKANERINISLFLRLSGPKR